MPPQSPTRLSAAQDIETETAAMMATSDALALRRLAVSPVRTVCVWRKRRDSNPRYTFWAYAPLAGECLRPLGHVSGAARKTYGNASPCLSVRPLGPVSVAAIVPEPPAAALRPAAGPVEAFVAIRRRVLARLEMREHDGPGRRGRDVVLDALDQIVALLHCPC